MQFIILLKLYEGRYILAIFIWKLKSEKTNKQKQLSGCLLLRIVMYNHCLFHLFIGDLYEQTNLLSLKTATKSN